MRERRQSRWERPQGGEDVTKKAKRSTWKKKCLLRGDLFLVVLREGWEKKGKNPSRVCVVVMIQTPHGLSNCPTAQG